MSPATSTITNLRSSLAQRRSERREQQQLERELATYNTPADRLELDLLLERHTADETAQIKRILDRQAAARLVSSF
ncbi:MAG: hypothetical protein ACXV3C_00150 [Actinomycetes bacterium]